MNARRWLGAVLLLAALVCSPRPGWSLCDSCYVCRDSCYSAAPAISDTGFSNHFLTHHMAVFTREPEPLNNTLYCVTIFDLDSGTPAVGASWANIYRYHGPPGALWDAKASNAHDLGTVFGVTLDKYGNIYVAHTSCYNTKALGFGGAGAVYRIDATTGIASVFAVLPQSAQAPGLGNITYDGSHNQFFVSDMEDGRIYRLIPSGSQNATATVSAVPFDPGAPDDGTAGFPALGERVWGVQWHCNRVYYGIWSDDAAPGLNGEGAASPGPNTVWSVGLLPNGDFKWTDVRHEITVPNCSSGSFSDPVTDISFSVAGNMLIGTRSMTGPGQPSAHRSPLYEYQCATPDGGTPTWSLILKYQVGQGSLSENCAGGVDYDNSTGRVWATGDALITSGNGVYGLTGLTAGNSSWTQAQMIDADGDPSSDKFEMGDVEIPCSATGSGSGWKWRDDNRNGLLDPGESKLPGWGIDLINVGDRSAFHDTTDLMGGYRFTGIPPGHYRLAEVTQPGWLSLTPPGGAYDLDLSGVDLGVLPFGNVRPPRDTCIVEPVWLLGWWPLDEPSGPTAHDLLVGEDGTWMGSPVVVPGKVGNALQFNAATDYVAVPFTNAENVGTGDFSLDAWIRTAVEDQPGTDRTIVDKRTGPSPEMGYSLFIRNGDIGIQLADGGSPNGYTNFESGPVVLADGSWHHVAATVQRSGPSVGRLFVDGKIVKTFDPSSRSGSLTNSGQFRIGQARNNSSAAFRGAIDEVEFFGIAVDTTSMKGLYLAGAHGKCKTRVSVPSVMAVTPTQTTIPLILDICNDDWGAASRSFDWTLAGLPASADCGVDGPTAFDPMAGSVTVAAGTCVPVTVSITPPAGLVPGASACYQLTVGGDAGSSFDAVGRLRGSRIRIPNHDLDLIPAPGSTSIPFTLYNDGAATVSTATRLVNESSEGDTTYRVLSLNGLPIHTPVTGNVSVAAGDSTVVSVPAAWVRPERRPIQEVVLWLDADGTGTLVPTDAVRVTLGGGGAAVGVGPPGAVADGRVTTRPNPFASRTAITFSLAQTEHVQVVVADVSGRIVRHVFTGPLAPGLHALPWDGRDDSGAFVHAGMFFVKVRGESRVLTTRAVRIQ